MCIRDSVKDGEIILWGTGNDPTMSNAKNDPRVIWIRVKMDGTLAVSYTHLRAHETVLDLVCRLLLDTKKKYNAYTLLFMSNKNNTTTLRVYQLQQHK